MNIRAKTAGDEIDLPKANSDFHDTTAQLFLQATQPSGNWKHTR